MFKRLEKEIIMAMKAKNKERLSALKVFKSDILKEKIDNKLEVITDEVVVNIATTLSKQMEKSLKIVEDAKNRELLNVVNEFLPQPINSITLHLAIANILAENPGYKVKDVVGNIKDSELSKRYSINFGEVSKIAKEMLG